MRVYILLVLTSGCFLAADEMAPIGIVRGDLVSWSGAANAGELHIRIADGRVYRCNFDPKTYFERDNQRITAGAMAAGDRIEIVSDHKIGSSACYARTVHMSDQPSARVIPGVRPRLRSEPSPTESFAPRGDLTFSGVVVRVDRGLLTLHTRNNGRQTILLRPDTRYLGEGMKVDPSHLTVNTRVFVRAGRNLDNEIEAYQVIWGTIVQPQ